jgi:hypothetical protein
MGVVIEICIKCPAGRTWKRGTDMAMRVLGTTASHGHLQVKGAGIDEMQIVLIGRRRIQRGKSTSRNPGVHLRKRQLRSPRRPQQAPTIGY